MTNKSHILIKRITLSLVAFLLLVIILTIYANVKVEKAAAGKIYTSVDSVPHNKVALLLGTNPLNKWGRPNSYFTNRIKTASELYHSGKVDYIIASGDNHTKEYDEPTAMRDSLIAHGVPEDRIILDFAGFRTLDSVVRSKEVFGCDSLTIISQADHNARALYLAEANEIEAVAISAPLRAGRWVRTRLALREWLARDKMMLDIWFGKQPHFLGEKIVITDIVPQKNYSTSKDVSMRIVNQADLKAGVDSLVMEFENNSDHQKSFGDYYRIETQNNGRWKEVDYDVLNDGKEHLVTVFDAVAYLIEPHEKRQYVNYTSLYGKNLVPGNYRLVKCIGNDTVYVEFQIR